VKIFEDYCIKRNLIEYSIEILKRKLNCFFIYLCENGVNSPKQITPIDISRYIATLNNYAKRTCEHHTSALRGYFRALFFAGYLPNNLAESVPRINKPRSENLSMVWRNEDLEKIFAAIDRGSAVGKRDYAILTIAKTYGIRAGDIRALKLENFDWNNSTIQFVQSKTGKSLSLPLSEKVGSAVVDYLKYGRPKTDSRNIFVKHVAPYDGISSIGYIFKKYLTLASIVFDDKLMHGVHTLRHTLASDLLEKSVPIEVIAGILGHTTAASSKRYLHLDFDNLRKCALEVPCGA
jgi:site-specific recombinase XerD